MVTKMFLESELLCEKSDHYVLTGPMITMAIPDTLQDSLMARLDQMNTAKEVAQLGSVLGREFSYEMLQAISSQDEETLQTGLTQLVDAELLYQRGRLPQVRYIFKHALIQDAAYASLLRSTCQQIHQQIAHTIEEQFHEMAVAQPELVAHHYTEAGLGEPAITWWQRAGELSNQQLAYYEAIAHLTRGLGLIETLPETSDRAAKEIQLHRERVRPLQATKGTGALEVKEACTHLIELWKRSSDTDATSYIVALHGLRAFYTSRAEHRLASEIGAEFLRIAEQANDRVLLASAHFHVATSFFYMGSLRLALEHFQHSMVQHEPSAPQVTVGTALDVSCRCQSSVPMWLLGYPDQARQRCHEALTISQQRIDPFSHAIAQLWALNLHAVSREWGSST